LEAYFKNDLTELYNCNCAKLPLPDESVHTCITSPPYYGLRSYGTSPQVWGGATGCEHEWVASASASTKNARQGSTETGKYPGIVGTGKDNAGQFCTKCGAWRGELGAEPTPELYVEHMVEVFREVRRVLRKDGTLWLVIGDSWNGSGGAGGDYSSGGLREGQPRYPGRKVANLKPKDLIGIPWRVALALQEDGWWLRSDIVWQKKSPFPESVQDRPSKAHEYVFLLSKSRSYFYDAYAIREPSVSPVNPGRNKRSVWTLSSEPCPLAHFAVFPTKLVEPMILAGTSSKGCCPQCGAPWKRVLKRSSIPDPSAKGSRFDAGKTDVNGQGRAQKGARYLRVEDGYEPTCKCGASSPVPCTVLDPFAGAGTTMLVAQRLGRRGVGIELNPEYCDIAIKRLTAPEPTRRNKKHGSTTHSYQPILPEFVAIA
jgi:DNA modification methylase